jgi:hypothetical protein
LHANQFGIALDRAVAIFAEAVAGFVRALGRDVEIKFPERDDEDYDRRGKLLMRV